MFSTKIAEKNRNTNFIFSNCYPKIVLFTLQCGKTW